MNPLKVFINNLRRSIKHQFIKNWPIEGEDFKIIQHKPNVDQDFIELLKGKWKGLKYGYGVVKIGEDHDDSEATHIHYSYGVIEWPPEINTPEKRVTVHDDPEFKTLLGDIAVVLLNSHYKDAEVDSGWKKI